jgi:hypothetical protein
MKVEIEITCEDAKDLMGHLSVVRSQIKQALKDEPEGDGIRLIEFNDGNIYGQHSIKITL